MRKAVITAAGRGHRSLPVQVFVDRDGEEKSALQIIIEEAARAGVEEICVVVCPGDQETYLEAAGDHGGKLVFVEQAEARGYGHALFQARDFVERENFLHLVSDHLYISSARAGCARQVVELAEAESCAVSAVQATRENMLPYYGTVGARRVSSQDRQYQIECVVEKPTPTQAEQRLIVPGLRAGHYLCLFGIHVLTPRVMDLLAGQAEDATIENVQLSPALNRLAAGERYLALAVQGRRHNMGVKYGALLTQLALGLSGRDREDILAQLVELVAARQQAEG